jgi:hypothetical protein
LVVLTVPTAEAEEVLHCSLIQTPPHFWITTFTHIAPQATAPLELGILETVLMAKT